MSKLLRPSLLAAVAAMVTAAITACAGPPEQPRSVTLAPTGDVRYGQLVFRDEFVGTSLGPAWTPLRGTADYRHGGPFNPTKENQGFAAGQVTLVDGHLTLRAEPRPITVDGKTYPYTSGMVQSRDNFEFQYGYLEFRMKVPQDRGHWPSAWLVGSVHEMAEIDVAEFLTDHTGRYGPMSNVHWGTDWATAKQWGLKILGAHDKDYAQDWHVYGLRWDAGAIQTYVDGVPGPRFEGANVPQEPMYLIFNLSVHEGANPAPATMLVDYVRIWK